MEHIGGFDPVTWRRELRWPEGRDLDPAQLPRWIAELGETAIELGAPRLAQLCAAAVEDPASPDRMFELGYALIDANLPEAAATILWHCLALVGDSEEVVCELVSALECALAYDDAFAILERHAALRARSGLCTYLYAFNAAMTGRLDVARAQLLHLSPDAADTGPLRDTISAITERADRVAGVCALDGSDLRGWHYVLTGGLLLHRELVPAGAEHAHLDHLIALVRELALPVVYAAPGARHERLAEAVADRLAVPVAPWPVIGTPAPGLVVIDDLGDVDDPELARLKDRRDDQIVFARTAPWTRDCLITPDITATRYSDTAVAGDYRDEPAQWDALRARVWPPEPGRRSRLWAGGPVLCLPP